MHKGPEMEKHSPTIQLYLPVQTRLEKSFDHYLGVSNKPLIEGLKSYLVEREETLIFLVGPESVGKTHLLSSSIHYFEEEYLSKKTCAYFSLAELLAQTFSVDFSQELLEYFEVFDFVALDDIDIWLSALDKKQKFEAERFLFNLFNYFKMNGKQLMIASKCPPARLDIDLKDLQSRLSSGLLLTVSALNDDEKDELIRSLAKLKGFLMDDDVSAFILKRSGRDIATLIQIIEDLDKATLIEKRKLSVPFVKKILNW